MRRMLPIAVLWMLTAVVPAMASTMYARFSAPVRSGTAFSATTLGMLQQGEAIQVVGRENSYYRVSYRDQAGYVYFNKLTAQKPQDVAALLGGSGVSDGIQLTELEAGGALRGLSPMAEKYAASGEVPGWAVQAVEDMQGRHIDMSDLEAFQREGGLGEYAGEELR